MQNTILIPELNKDETGYELNGKPVFNKTFDKAMNFHLPEGLAAVKDKSGAYHLDLNGKPAYNQRFEETFGFYENIATVKDKSGYGHIDSEGNFVHSKKFNWSGNFQEGACTVCDVDGFYHIDKNGNPLYKKRFEYAGDFKYRIACVSLNNLWWHIYPDGSPVHNKRFLGANVYHKGYAVVKDEKGYFHINLNGEEIYSHRFAYLEPFYNGTALAETFDGKYVRVYESGNYRHLKAVNPYTNISEIKNKINQGFKVGIILRHSERYKIPETEWGQDVGLTENGKKYAEKLGNMLKNQYKWQVYSSPSGRCIDTGRNMATGFEQTGEDIKISTLLGGPGSFVDVTDRYPYKPEEFANVALEYLTYGFKRGFVPLTEGCNKLLNFIRKTLKDQNTIYVTHDLFVAGLKGFLNLKIPTREDWAEYLEGVVFFEQNGEIAEWKLLKVLEEVKKCLQ